MIRKALGIVLAVPALYLMLSSVPAQEPQNDPPVPGRE